MRIHRNTIWLIPLAILITFPFWSIPVGNFLTPRGGFDPDINKENNDHHNFTMQTVTILQNQKGQDTAIIRAAHARTREDDLDVVVLDKVNAEVFDDNGNVTQISSESGEYNMSGKMLTLIQEVVLNKAADKQSMYTDLLIYDTLKRTVKSPGKTKLKSENAMIEGGSFDYNVNTQTYVFSKKVKCLINGFIEP
jgi:LPS export ABC transporter protein LptC